jgi:hypothetical protein
VYHPDHTPSSPPSIQVAIPTWHKISRPHSWTGHLCHHPCSC